MKKTAIAFVLAVVAGFAYGQTTPVGLWKTIDDDGKTEKSHVRITESGGALNGVVEKIFDPARQADVCKECTDERKDKPVLGMTIIRGVKKAGAATWEGGDILDPNNGKVYRVRLEPVDGGKRLDVRGFIGISLFGRSQTWIRVE